jgi:hypothetical protein
MPYRCWSAKSRNDQRRQPGQSTTTITLRHYYTGFAWRLYGFSSSQVKSLTESLGRIYIHGHDGGEAVAFQPQQKLFDDGVRRFGTWHVARVAQPGSVECQATRSTSIAKLSADSSRLPRGRQIASNAARKKPSSLETTRSAHVR